MIEMSSRTIEMSVDGVEIYLRLRKATIGDDMRRVVFVSQANEAPLADSIDQLGALLIYPRCLACLVEGKIGDKDARGLTAREFLDLPSEVGAAWSEAMIELNPGWRIDANGEDVGTPAQKKKD